MFAVLVGYGAALVWDDYRYEVTSPGLGVPQWLLHGLAAGPVAGDLRARASAALIRAWRGRAMTAVGIFALFFVLLMLPARRSPWRSAWPAPSASGSAISA